MSRLHLKYWRKVKLHPPGGVRYPDISYGMSRWTTSKVRWVLDRHKTADPIGSTFTGVVSRQSVRKAFTYNALNDLQVFAADICNAYLQAPSFQKDYVVCGPEFGIENVGKVALIHRTLYGGKRRGQDFRNHLRSCMYHLDFRPCLADPDVWMRPAQKGDGSPLTEVWILQGIYPLKDEWVFGCSLKTRLADQTKDSTTEVVMVK